MCGRQLGLGSVPLPSSLRNENRYDSHRQPLPEEVAAYLRERIISGEVKPGEYLRMEPIAEALGVSNTPVREGLLALRSEGFVRLVPRRGFVVASFSRQDVRDLFWIQAQLAGELAARAAKTVTPERLERLQDLVDEHEKVVAEGGNTDDIASLAHLFHREINLTAHSDHLALLLGHVVRQLPNRFYAEIEGQVGGSLVDHPSILEALRDRDSRRARRQMEKHLLGRADQLIEMLELRGVWKDGDERAS